MNELKLHALGSHDHLEALRKRYNSLKEKIKGNTELTEPQKESKLKALDESFKEEKKNIQNNNY